MQNKYNYKKYLNIQVHWYRGIKIKIFEYKSIQIKVHQKKAMNKVRKNQNFNILVCKIKKYCDTI